MFKAFKLVMVNLMNFLLFQANFSEPYKGTVSN